MGGSLEGTSAEESHEARSVHSHLLRSSGLPTRLLHMGHRGEGQAAHSCCSAAVQPLLGWLASGG